VVGGGQSALESAALLHESGAKVDVISRRPIHWLTDEEVENRTLLQRIRSPKAGIAPGWFNWILENAPYAFQQLPRTTKDHLLHGRASYGPAGSGWLRSRVIGHVKLHERQTVREVKEADNGVRLILANGDVLRADALLLATGYRVNVWKLPMLHASVVSRIQTYQDAPVLNSRFESSVAGLYFVGISALSSFGPLYRFVVGTQAAARRVAGAVARQVALLK
jgi:cation diffusion facilitator CzcD-associated flavoprotein CzcO